MTPKEKAEELFNKYWELNVDFDGLIKYEFAKQCALIAVDEIIEILSKDINPLINYWFEVKQEIEKI